MGLLDALGLQLQAAAPGAKSARDLTDADFAADAKRRKLADQEALKKGRELTKEKPEAPGKGPAADPIDAEIDKLIGDPEERLKALGKWKVPTFSETYKDDTPLIRFLADLKSGTEQADKVLGYMQQVAEYAEKMGDLKALERIGPAASQLKKISGRIASGLKTFGGLVDKAQKIARWCVEMNRCAQASAEMKASDRESVKRWIKSLQNLWDATAPFLEWLQSKALSSALAGSEVAGVAGATLIIVTAQLFVGLKMLEAGVHNVDAYFNRMDERMREIEGMPQKPKATLPESPGEWSTREEVAANFKRKEDADLRTAIRRERNAEQARTDEAAAATREDFEENVLPKLYIGHRQKIRDAVYAAYRKAKGDPKSTPALWWDCLVPDDAPVEVPDDDRPAPDEDTPLTLDDRDEFDIEKRKEGRISLEDARIEVRQFLNLKSPCPPFVAVHGFELKKYLAARN